jgi:hypothetical protein
MNIFEAIEVGISMEDIKFTKRIGERGEEPRPLLTGFYSEAEKVSVLKNARRLDNTNFKNVSIVPDLTRRQREEEKDLKKVAEERNRSLNDADLAKNLHWTVVGSRGERRIEKRLKETTARGRDPRRGSRTDFRGRGILTGANRTALDPRSRKVTDRDRDRESGRETNEEENSDMETEEEPEGEREEPETGTRPKTTKRKDRSRGSVSDSPPEKR